MRPLRALSAKISILSFTKGSFMVFSPLDEGMPFSGLLSFNIYRKTPRSSGQLTQISLPACNRSDMDSAPAVKVSAWPAEVTADSRVSAPI